MKGFTLIETLVAVSILSLSIAGPLYSASRAIVLAQISRDELVASYLAQEGIEYMRAMRDDAYLNSYRNGGADVSGAAWADFVAGGNSWSIAPCVAAACTLDPTLPQGYGPGYALNTSSGAALLYLNNGIYTHQQVGTRTPFTRTVRATSISPTEERVVSTVSWSFHEVPYTITLVDYLTPWQ